LELANPRANKSASKILDFPEPLGPEMTVNPFSRGTDAVPPKDLKWDNSTRVMCTDQEYHGRIKQTYYVDSTYKLMAWVATGASLERTLQQLQKPNLLGSRDSVSKENIGLQGTRLEGTAQKLK
jgi:hypothetical protein